MTRPTIAILGWGSLIWDMKHKDALCFDKWHGPWLEDGPSIKLEFSRISMISRPGALTLVIDPVHGAACRVFYCLSKRIVPDDAFEDLRKRENIPLGRDGNVPRSIGRVFRDKNRRPVCRDQESCKSIQNWADGKSIDIVTWTDLPSNFSEVKGRPFSVSEALAHLNALSPDVRGVTLEYIRRAPPTVQTKCRQVLEANLAFR